MTKRIESPTATMGLYTKANKTSPSRNKLPKRVSNNLTKRFGTAKRIIQASNKRVNKPTIKRAFFLRDETRDEKEKSIYIIWT
jgi:hypothetical protein